MAAHDDRKEEAYAWLPTVEAIAGRVFGKGEGTAQMMHVAIKISLKAVIHNMKRLKEEGRAHIHAWTRTTCPAPVWVKGPGEDAPKPPKVPREELVRRSLERRYEKEAAERATLAVVGSAVERTARTIENARSAPRSWFSALEDAQGDPL